MNTPIYSFQGRPIVSEHAGITVTRVGPNLGAEITGVDLRRPISDEVRDAIEQVGDKWGRIVMRYAYDMLGNRIHQLSMEAGARWTLNDVAASSACGRSDPTAIAKRSVARR